MIWKGRRKLSALTACIPVVLLAAACGERDEVISNELMTEMYPETYRPGDPPYSERDFEAGADFICDEIKARHGRDFCAEPGINWRRPR